MEFLDQLKKAILSGSEMYGSASQPAPPEVVKGVLGFMPGVGDAISAYDAYDSAKQGNYGEAALNGLGLLPFVPSLGAGTIAIRGINKTSPGQLEKVLQEMKSLGAPKIRAYFDGEKYQALEGSHRLEAAKRLGLTPEIEEVGKKSWLTNHDLYDLPEKTSVFRALNYLQDSNAPIHLFD